MPLILKYFWFIAALFMLVNVFHVRTRLVALVDRGVASQREVNPFVLWLAGWFVVAPLILGAIGLAAGWSSPFCGGVMLFATDYQILASIANVAVWASVLWWVWRGAGADFLSRAGPALSRQPSFQKRYSPQSVRLVVTAFILLSSVGAIISWRMMPSSPDMTCPTVARPRTVFHNPPRDGIFAIDAVQAPTDFSRATLESRHAPTRTS